MTISDRLRRFLRRLYRLLTAPPAPERETLTRATGSTDQIEVAIYQTEALTDHRGGVPETMQARQLAHAFDAADVDYRIECGFEARFDPPVERPGSSMELFEWWHQRGPKTAEHCNYLLTDAFGGGRALLGGPVAVHGSSRIDRVHAPRDECDSAQCKNLWGGLHEVLHCLGGRHDTPMLRPKPSMRIHPTMVDLIHDRYGRDAP